jgi:hypothetical protein
MRDADPLGLMDEWGPEKVVAVSDTRTGMRACWSSTTLPGVWARAALA